MPAERDQLDVLIVGAGLSGISAAYHVRDRRYAILEGRAAMGGTWDLFRYPGIRSDSDMFTLGYRFRPWTDRKAIADGPSIKAYIEDTARAYGIDRQIRYEHRVVRAEWSSSEARWTVTAEVGPDRTPATFTARFLYCCTGYYDYERGYTPEWPGTARFGGRMFHPQHWPADLDYAGKRVVVIGSGATAVTLVPALAEQAAHVTMLQRSPSYVASIPGVDPIAEALRRILPEKLSYAAVRWKNVARAIVFYELARRYPELFKKLLAKGVEVALGKDHDRTHFTPRYQPWDERLCVVPDGDLFRALRAGTASIVTDTIATFDETGIVLASGARLDADIIVTATGLNMRLLAGLALVVDGKPIELADTTTYKGTMYSDVPNLATALGYTNASWTLKCDLTAEYVARLLAHMDRKGYAQVTPRLPAGVGSEPLAPLQSGYIQRALATLPKQGDRPPWKLYQNYIRDLGLFRHARLEDGALEWKRAATTARSVMRSGFARRSRDRQTRAPGFMMRFGSSSSRNARR